MKNVYYFVGIVSRLGFEISVWFGIVFSVMLRCCLLIYFGVEKLHKLRKSAAKSAMITLGTRSPINELLISLP